MKCSKCGTENPDGAKFCENCGDKLSEGNRKLILLGIAVMVILIVAVGLIGFIKPNNIALTLKKTSINVCFTN